MLLELPTHLLRIGSHLFLRRPRGRVSLDLVLVGANEAPHHVALFASGLRCASQVPLGVLLRLGEFLGGGCQVCVASVNVSLSVGFLVGRLGNVHLVRIKVGLEIVCPESVTVLYSHAVLELDNVPVRIQFRQFSVNLLEVCLGVSDSLVRLFNILFGVLNGFGGLLSPLLEFLPPIGGVVKGPRQTPAEVVSVLHHL